MKLKVLTVPLAEAGDGVVTRDLSAAIGDGKVKLVTSHTHEFEGRPHVVMVVGVAPATPSGGGNVDKLDPEDRAVFDALRAWRRARADAEGIAAYRVFTNQALAGIASVRPATRAALLAIRGIGPRSADLYATEVIACVKAAVAAGAWAGQSEPVSVT